MAIAALLSAPSAHAAIYYWDSNASTAGFGSTTGTWGTNSFWTTVVAGGATHTSVSATLAGDTVNFGSATLNYNNAAVAVLAGGVTATSIVFGAGQTTDLTVGAAGGGTITLASPTRTIQVNSSGHKILSPIALTGATTVNLNWAGGGADPAPNFTLGAMSGTGGLILQNTAGGNPNPANFILNGASTYTGTTLLDSTTTNASVQLTLGVANALPTTTVLTIDGNAGTGSGRLITLNMNGKNQTLAGLTSVITGTLRDNRVLNSSGTLSILTIDGSASTNYGGLLGSGGTNIRLVKSGSGTFTLSGNAALGTNTYAAGTILNQGRLTVAVGGTLGATTGTLTVNNNNTTAAATDAILNLATDVNTTVGTLSGTISPPTSGTNPATINTQTSRTFTVNQTSAGTYAGVIAGAGNFTLGSLSTNALTLSGANTFSGNIIVNAGTLIGAGATNSPGVTVFGSRSNTRTITVNNGGTLQFNSGNVLGANHTAITAPTLIINSGGVVTNGSIATNNALNNVQLNDGTLTSTTGHTSSSPPNDPVYGAWNINGAITSTGTSTISTSDPTKGWIMLKVVGDKTTDFNVTSGTLTVSAPVVDNPTDSNIGSLSKSGVGTMVISGNNTYAGGTILNQGTLTVDGGTLGATSGILTVNNNNTTAAGTDAILNLATAVDTTVGTLSGTISAPLSGTNTATINTQTGRTFTVNQTAAGTYAGVIAGAGNFTLGSLSTNALTLSGTNTYSGATTINAGTLSVNGSISNSAVTLSSGTLTGSGTVNTVNVANSVSAIVSNNNGSPGAALTTGALTFDGAATVNTFSSSTTSAIITSSLATNVAGTVTINPSAASWSPGIYDLISYGGGSVGGAGSGQFVLGTVFGLTARQSKTLGDSTTAITLTVGADDSPYWAGDGDGKWNLASTNNWKLTSDNSNTVFLATDNVLFNDSASGAGPIMVDIDAANVAPTSTTFNNSTKDYVLNSTGSFGISSGILTKSGAGKVTINTANTYAGGTIINSGTLALGNANAISTGTLTLSGGNLDSSVADLVNAGNNVQAWDSDFTFVGTQNLNLGTGAVTMSADRTVTVSANTLTVGGVIGGGAVGLTKLGAGTLNLTATNTYTGTNAVNAGTLALSPAGALTSSHTFTGTGTLNTNPGTGNLTLNGDLSGFSGIINVAAPLASPGKLNTGGTSLLGAGTIVNILNGGTWFFNTATQAGITVNISGAGNAEGLGALRTDTGTIDSTSSVVLQANSSIGGNTNTNTGTINAVISENVGPFSLTKVGTNNIALGGANTYAGLTTVSTGSLILRNPSALGTTAAGTTVANNARIELDNITVTGEPITIVGTGGNNFGALQSRSGTSLWTGNVTIDADVSRIGAAAGASLEVSGVIDDGVNDYRVLYRMADAASTVIISGANTYTGGTWIVGTGPVIASSLNKVVGGTASSSLGAPVTEANGMLVFGSAGTPGILRYAGSGETTDRTIQIGVNSTTPVVGDIGSTTIEANGTTALNFSAPNFNTPTNAVTGTSPTRTLTLGGTNANANTIAGIIRNNQIAGNPTAAVALTKTGTGSWALAGANSYTGATTIDQGTLAFSTTDQSLTGGLVFGSTSGSTNTGTLDLSTASATFTGAALVRTNSATANTITIGATKTLTLNGGLTIGYDPGIAPATTSKLTVDGGGSMAVNGTTITIGQGLTANNQAWTSTGTLDVSSLASFSTNVTNFNLGVGVANGTGSNGILLLSNTANTLVATTLKVGDTLAENGGGGTTTLTLGTGTNVIQADTIEIGKGKASGTGYKMAFASQTAGSPGTVTIANKAGSGAAIINIANMGTTGTGGVVVASMDLRGHDSTVNASTLLIAQSNNGTGTNVSGSNGTVHFDAGTTTVGTLNMGLKTGASTGTATGTLNVGGGTFTVNTAFTLGSHAGAGASVATLNLTGGTFTSNANITQGGGSTTSTINLDGGTLDMTGKNIGSANTVNVDAKSGTLKNVAEINNGGTLTKDSAGTLILDGINTYTGNTVVDDGTFALADNAQLKFVLGATTGVNNSISGAGTVTLNGDFVIDTLAADALASGSWTLENVPSLSGAYGSTFTVVGFTNAGSDKWTKVNGAKLYTFDETTGILTLAPSAGYASWAAINAIGSAANLDKDGDGVNNAVEYVLGGDVNTNDLSKLPQSTISGTNLIFTFQRKVDTIDGSTVVEIEVGTDLSTWPTVYTVGADTAGSTPGVVVTEDSSPGFDTITLTVPMGTDPKKFARLAVEVP